MAIDPYVAQLQGLFSAQSAADTAKRQTGVRQAFVDFGADIDSSFGFDTGFFNQDIDQATRELANQNTSAGLSTMARFARDYEDATRNIHGDLAARGLLDSGETAFKSQRLALGQKQQTYDASKNILEYLRGVYGAFAQAEQGRGMGMLEAQQQAGQRAQDREFQMRNFALQEQSMLQAAQQAQAQLAQAEAHFNAQMAANAAMGGGGGGGGGGDTGGGGGGGSGYTQAQFDADRALVMSVSSAAGRDAKAETDAAFREALHRYRAATNPGLYNIDPLAISG